MQWHRRALSALNRVYRALKTYYGHVLAGVFIIGLILIVYGHDLQILFNEAVQNEALSHILLIPILAGILAYMKKDTVKASLALWKQARSIADYTDELVGLILCLVAFLVYWYGSFTFYALEYHLLSLPIFMLGMILVLFNLKTMIALVYPTLFLIFLVPPPSNFLYNLGGTLAGISTHTSFTLLKAMNLPVTLSTALGPPTILLSGVPYEVDLACSGIYSLMAFAAFAVFLALVASASVPRKAVLAVIGFLTFVGLNILRITTIISIANVLGQDIAMNVFHTVEGYVLIFIGMILTLIIAERLLKMRFFPAQREQPSCPHCRTSIGAFCESCGKFFNKPLKQVSQRFWTKLFLLIIGCSVVTLSMNAPTFAIAQGPSGMTSMAGLENATSVFPQVANYTLQFWYRDTIYEQETGQDGSFFYRYLPTADSSATSTNDSESSQPDSSIPAPTSGSAAPVYVDVGISGSISNLHNWESCLISWQVSQGRSPLVSIVDSRDIALLPDVPLVAHYLVFNGADPVNYTQVTLYWYEQAPFNTGLSVQQRYFRISLIILLGNQTGFKQYEDELLPMAQSIASYWEPLKSQSLVSLGIPALQALLITSALMITATKTTWYANEQRKKDNNSSIFENFASAKEKTVLQTIQELTQKTKITHTEDISLALQEKTRIPVEPAELQGILDQLAQYGFIRKDLAVKDSKPILAWKV
jgi:exosortase